MNEYNKRLVEVDEVLKHLSEEDYKKIPEEIIQVIRENKDENYIWKYDESKELKDQLLSRDTIAFLSYLNIEYLLNEKQKDLMKQIYVLKERKIEEEKSKQYSVDNLFKRTNTQKEEVEENSLIEYKESLFVKIVNKIKRFLTKR